jgi:lipid A 4'-phosphatase
MWLAFFTLSLIFIFFSQIDLFVANLFYDGKTFPANHTILEEFFYYSVKPILLTFVSFTLLVFIYNFFTKKNILNINAKVLLYLFLSLAIAPGLIVNVTLKENWGRARPAQTTNFGGTKEFTPAFMPSNQNGYSFSSGHTAAAFSLMAFALLARKRQKTWLSLVFSYGILVSIARMASGGHFLSDVVTSFFLVYIFTYIFYGLIFKEPKDLL